MAKILLTGGAGYIGSHTNLALAEAGHETVVFDNLSTGFKELVVAGELIVGDLLDKQAISDVLREGRFDAVIHFAAKNFVGESFENPALYWSNNVVGTLNLLDAMAQFGPSILVFSSSCAVYGEPESVPITEEHCLAPLNPYGKTKLVCEWIIEDFAKATGLKYGNLRYFNAVGADPKGRVGLLWPNHPQLLQVCIDVAFGAKESMVVLGDDYPTPDGTGLRDFIHVSDLANAHISALERLFDSESSFTLNLGVGRAYSVLEVITEVEKQCDCPLRYSIVNRRNGDPAISVADSTKANRLLNWYPKIADLEAIVRTAIEWRRHNENPAR